MDHAHAPVSTTARTGRRGPERAARRPAPHRLSAAAATAASLGLAISLAACTTTGTGAEAPVVASESSGGASIEVSDATGRLVTVPADAQRIVALDEYAYGLLISLGREPVATLQWLGDQSVNIDPSTTVIEGTGADLPLEAITGQRPDLLVGTGHPSLIEAAKSLDALAPTVLVGFNAPLDDQLELTGAITGEDERAERVGEVTDARSADIAGRLSDAGLRGTSVSVIGNASGFGPYTVPADILAGELLTGVGLVRPASEDVDNEATGTLPFSPELLEEHVSDVLYELVAGYSLPERLSGSPLLATSPAVADGDVWQVRAEPWAANTPYAAW